MTIRCLTPSDWPHAEALFWELTKSGAVGTEAQFRAVLDHAGTSILAHEVDGQITSMVTVHILPNMTYGGRPYALIENVITAAAHRMKGHGRDVMRAAIDMAKVQHAYKVMLLTGQGRNAKGFYEAVGFSADEKWGMMIRFE